MHHSRSTLLTIEQILTRERLKRYLVTTSNDLAAAISLYEQNVALSEAVFGLLHGIEIAVRNSMHDALSSHFGSPTWFQTSFGVLTGYHRDKVAHAIKEAGGLRASPGKVVAELTFGFWTDLAAQRYLWTLWQPCLHRAFPEKRLARAAIHGRLDLIRKLRNRIAHHEPVLTSRRALYAGSGLLITPEQLIECVDWIARPLGAWLRTGFRFYTVSTILETVAASGITL